MSSEAAAAGPLGQPRPFTKPDAFRRPDQRDHLFFPWMVALIWLGIGMGFGLQLVRRAQTHAPPFPKIVWLHAVVFVGWLCVFTVQVLLVRFRRADVHRRVGKAAIYLFAVVPIMGLATALVFQHVSLGTPQGNPAFLSVQLADLLSFTVLGTAALRLRRVPQAHKRLMLLALVFIADAGFARWLGGPIFTYLSPGVAPQVAGFWPNYVSLFFDGPLLVGLMALYDWITRRRLHPVFVLGAAFGLGMQLLAIALYVMPWWRTVATAIVRL